MENNITYQNIKEVIDNWDPIDLLSMHCPSDEYDNESQLIYQKISSYNLISINILSKVIYEIFFNNFGDELFTNSIDDCERIANLILQENFKKR